MYSTEDTHHFPAYGVAPDYWAQRALGSNHQGQPLALAPNFATERLLASESLLREREHATAHAERRNASREKQLGSDGRTAIPPLYDGARGISVGLLN